MAAPAPQALTENGWKPAGPRLWAHGSYGEARFDSWEALELERRPRVRRPTRPPLCSCSSPLVDLRARDLTCVYCGRRTSAAVHWRAYAVVRRPLATAQAAVAARYRRAELDAEAREQVDRILLEVGSESAGAAALPGDAWRLRGLPAIGGRGSVGGAIRGTVPHVDGVRNADRNRRF